MSRLGRFVFLLILCIPGLALPQQTAPGKTGSGPAQQHSANQQNPKPQDPEAEKARKPARPDYVPKGRPTAFDAARVTVAQLEEVLRQAHGRRDAQVAQVLSRLELKERLSGARLATWKVALPGNKARQALVAMADMSAFLDLPATEIPALAAPAPEESRRMLLHVVDYLSKTMRQLPNLTATRTTTIYQDTLKEPDEEDMAEYGGQPWRLSERFSSPVLYRDGKEVVDAAGAKSGKAKREEMGLAVQGTFGPFLSMVIADAVRGKIYWDHWEQGPAGLEAVFRYVVPETVSQYGVTYRSISGDHGTDVLQQRAGYHGEFAVDPASGAILRVTLETNLAPTLPLLRSDMMMEYGAVEMGGKPYVCPVRGVSISSGWAIVENPEDGQSAFGPEVTVLSDIAYGQYRLLRAD